MIGKRQGIMTILAEKSPLQKVGLSDHDPSFFSGERAIREAVLRGSATGSLIIALLLSFILSFPTEVWASDSLRIIDYRSKLNRKFEKVKRRETHYIIVHTSEGGLTSTLRTVSSGKKRGNRVLSLGGHAHYVISENGIVYRTLDKEYVADHAGLSMWNGLEDISKYSIGIELVGYHYGVISDRQYSSLHQLLVTLQKVYKISDKDVLTHAQVAYGFPNTWFKSNHRGRKKCAMNFERTKAGLTDGWTYDPDVRSNRLTEDVQLASVIYGEARRLYQSNIISSTLTAWSIAGDEYGEASTLYEFPNGQVLRGDQVERAVGWNKIPVGTKVLLNQEETSTDLPGEMKKVESKRSARTLAGIHYNSATTFYLFTDGAVKSGEDIQKEDEIAEGTLILIEYRGPFVVSNICTPYSLAGLKYKDRDVIYLFPDQTIKTGDTISDFRKLPKGTMVFVPLAIISQVSPNTTSPVVASRLKGI